MKVQITARGCASMPWAYGAILLLPFSSLTARGEEVYQKPPKNVLEILDAPATPLVSMSPTRDRLLLVQGTNYPSIAELAQPMLRLAGQRINPQTNGPHRPLRHIAYTLQTIADGKETRIDVPADAHLGIPAWSPDGKHFAFTNTVSNGIQLWIGDAETGKIRRIPEVFVNSAYTDARGRFALGGDALAGSELHWMPDHETLLCKTVPAGRRKPPIAAATPRGPKIQQSTGKSDPVWTYQDLLKDPHDLDLFDYYATSELVLVNVRSGQVTRIGEPAVFASAEPSPDGNHVLVVRNHRPYSYLHPASAFPKEVEVWDRSGKTVFKLASLPLEEQVPIDGVPTGPRAYQWRPTEAATLMWVEALDDGNPKKKVPHRDRVLMLKAPFGGKAVEIAKTVHRFAGLTWEEKGELALLREYDRDRRWGRTLLIRPDAPEAPPRLVWDRSIRDRYGDPGTPISRRLPNGHRVVQRSGNAIFLAGQGASPGGDRPFLDRFDLTTLQAERLFQCDAKSYESVVAVVADDASRIITRRETVSDPPNYFLRTVGDAEPKALTKFVDPAPQLRGIKKQLVTYKRADGVQLSFTLYLPPDYEPGKRLPTVMWAYPLEFTDADTAGQVSGSANHFTTIRGISHLFFLLQGYAVLDGPTLPVVRDVETVNHTYIEQIVASAKAAIDKADEMAVTDRNRVGVGGHSYGAFMTANLLAHSDLFKAGIARSGAYNRTLTPFGFQSERRTLWEAPDVYIKVSPFMNAHKIKTPLLLIHGEADNNSGTFPIQSERMYHAVRGNGGIVRYVVLPFESHGYQARESVEHTLYEMISWFDKYVRNAPEKSAAGSN